jgi:Dolichyl-phosphate-mannose-protein mannosyltransferase
LAVAALTLAALLVRGLGLDQSLWGDELYTFDVLRDGTSGVLDRSNLYDLNPPLYFWLASFTDGLGDRTIWLRAPSVVLGAATVPLLYRLGALTVGREAGLAGAAILAFGPFAAWYATEARAYVTAGFFVVATAVALLSALETERRAWWVGFWLAATGAVYSHYTSGFTLAVLVVWALWTHPAQRRAVLVSSAAVVVAFLPYLSTFNNQTSRPLLETPITAEILGKSLARLVAGHPQLGVRPVVGIVGVAVLIAAAVAAVAAVVARAVAARRAGSLAVPRELVLVVALAAATPVGLVIYLWAGGASLGLPRFSFCSLPAICLALGAAICALPGRAALVVTAAVAAVLCVGALKTMVGPFQRPQVRSAAHLVDDRARRNAPVVEVPSLATVALRLSDVIGPFNARLLPESFVGPLDELAPPGREISVHFRRPHPQYGIRGYRTVGFALQPVADPRAWAAGAREGHLYVISGERPGVFLPPAPPPGSGLRVAAKRSYEGTDRVVVQEYVATRASR